MQYLLFLVGYLRNLAKATTLRTVGYYVSALVISSRYLLLAHISHVGGHFFPWTEQGQSSQWYISGQIKNWTWSIPKIMHIYSVWKVKVMLRSSRFEFLPLSSPCTLLFISPRTQTICVGWTLAATLCFGVVGQAGVTFHLQLSPMCSCSNFLFLEGWWWKPPITAATPFLAWINM